MIQLDIVCDKCSESMSEFDVLFCEKCYIAIQEKMLLEITELKDKVKKLEEEAEDLAEEVRWRSFI